jgi:drug/metabolite transporter (DMT)-like permease
MKYEPSRSERNRAVAALFFSCFVWGMAFTWIKNGQSALGGLIAERAGRVPGAEDIGPGAFLAVRFTLVTLCWMLLFPAAVKNFSRQTLVSGSVNGFFLAVGLWLQHYGLAKASEALTAFLTGLVVFFTPLVSVVVLRERINPRLILPIAAAILGIALMTSFRPEGGFDSGATLGLLCAVVFSANILIVDRYCTGAEVWPFSLASFFICAISFWAAILLFDGGAAAAKTLFSTGTLFRREVLISMLLASLVSTVLGFGLMFRYQAQLSATEAALIYTTEPIFASLYSWFAAGRGLTPEAAAGGALVFGASILAITQNGRKERHAPAESIAV